MTKILFGKLTWEKMSTDTNITDFCIAIRGYLIFSLLHCVLDSGETDTCLIIFNYRIWGRNTR